MKREAIIYNTATLNLPKNALQFLFGVLLFAMAGGSFNISTAIIAASGLSIGLGAIYLFNDLTDLKEDKNNAMKIRWKAVANGTMSRNESIALIKIFAVTGTALALLSGLNFFLIYLLVIGLNLCYSHPQIRWKNSPTLSVLTISLLQVLKFSSGWFLFTNTLEGFPILFVMAIAIGYALMFLYYKNNTQNLIHLIREDKKRVLPLSLACIIMLVTSFVIYAFPAIALMAIVLGVPTVGLYFLSKNYIGTSVNVVFMYAGLVILLLSFMLLSTPTVTAINQNMMDQNATVRQQIIVGVEQIITGLSGR
ncbi:MAG: phosphoribose diphosphate:decaprenyl-phosphate phosphoribosyltransferase [Candidatus Methanofastidiosum methylothiophilum]|uniref:Phosphoribose diphosphate:decaprenyl-phosphate phosphoribosyltransferase n=1 Tax=Candidatus Methanofastidiosum methylothiophilum TaxID=1705564 RepID=A0A150IK56_9EURY|nr:MAG: phosphoribose diphosphate:decaprenyl-phosphate phosphoribosyltransferase [Candidatus Methanofastidiosum methylthiophilus]KYC48482.1 MAG: phosphoribose diphosphate:decaprenyl-phosphate phosphoribosyltransferase [Candidatus Methanofastidiosum methylthiophilus]KYC49924.1 MAG: phosphoribose diphosphate:decaprenyl-phosphate phosphoribosyltransferase [Candidatus Methanofastidiosum methylthiophilus]